MTRASRTEAIAAWLKRRGGALAIFVLLFVVWEVGVRTTGIKEYLLPPPTKALEPAASLSNPPDTVEKGPPAMLTCPPPTVDEPLFAVLPLPPATVQPVPVTVFEIPPPTVE